MKIQIVSDLHHEFGKMGCMYERMCDAEADVLVLAGDISGQNNIRGDLLDIQRDSGKKVVFVPGNHEYYGTTRKRLDGELAMLNNINKDVHVLIESDFCIGDVCFLGSTGWWDGSSGGIGMNQIHGLNDFKMVYDLMDEGNLNGVKWGRQSKCYLNSRMFWLRKNLPSQKLCVITHHFPHRRSIAPAFEGSNLNPCFYNAWEWMIEEHKPELWIHGHTHNGFDYNVLHEDSVTRVVCNPQGYPMEYAMSREKIQEYLDKYEIVATEEDMAIYLCTENDDYDPQKIVEL